MVLSGHYFIGSYNYELASKYSLFDFSNHYPWLWGV
ncbi:hypothetical protein cce_0181 [Crocosphaera subtropica ATCC 51142]|uniref:Uncharacterized protein n=1 Tax=Crocosphaera subtropica (strain ATCC 51142 / BH68) TaxID=43989 RepID=B1X032_CROS5|nr:hypothetical protein cce_0181 [Crocosphaera subtropica ATCC 51142]